MQNNPFGCGPWWIMPVDHEFGASSGKTMSKMPAVCGEEPKLTRALPPQDSHLMSQGDELKLQGGAAANAEREQGNEGGKNCDHAPTVWRWRENF
jgi:hypothetical protein